MGPLVQFYKRQQLVLLLFGLEGGSLQLINMDLVPVLYYTILNRFNQSIKKSQNLYSPSVTEYNLGEQNPTFFVSIKISDKSTKNNNS